jgi:hypothetical protein
MNKKGIYDPIADRILGKENKNQNVRHLRIYDFFKKIATAVLFLMIFDDIWIYRPIAITNIAQDIVWLGFLLWIPIWYIYPRQARRSKILRYFCITVPPITIILCVMIRPM